MKIRIVANKGGQGSGHFGHAGIPGHLGGSADEGEGGEGKKPAGKAGFIGSKNLPQKGIYIKFDDAPNYHRVYGEMDTDFEKAKLRVERALGRPLKVDPKSGWPNFTYYGDGEELGGG